MQADNPTQRYPVETAKFCALNPAIWESDTQTDGPAQQQPDCSAEWSALRPAKHTTQFTAVLAALCTTVSPTDLKTERPAQLKTQHAAL